MNERISIEQLTPQVKRLRKAQVILAVLGMGFFLLALIGGANESRRFAWIGLFGFAICFVSVVAVGIWALVRGQSAKS
jgi:isoprenylcysteine carboxyl methyltransferase (ICMT) family protein YpbQ